MTPAMSAQWGASRVKGIGSGLDKVLLRNEKLTAEVSGAILGDIPVKRTIDGSSTVEMTLDDSTGRLRRLPLLQEASLLTVDGLRFRLVQTRKSGMNLSLTFEDEIPYRMRRKRGPKKAFRDQMTRSEFVISLAREAWPQMPIWAPERSVEQPIATEKQARSNSRKKESKGGIDRGANLTVKGARATPTQISVANQLLDAAMSYNPPQRALIALLCTATHESVMGTRGMVTPVDHDSIGVLQGRQMYNRREDLLSIPYNVRRFFKEPWTGTPLGGAIDQASKGRSIGDICTSIQGNDTGDVYTQWADEARAWLDAYGVGSGTGRGSGRRTVSQRYAYQVEREQDFWEASGNLMSEVNWRRFASENRLWLASDIKLMDSRLEMRLGEDDPGINHVDWDLHSNKRVHECKVTGRAAAWLGRPGLPVYLDASHGPAEGRWLVHSIEGYLTKDDFSATLKRPSKPLPEPAAETRTVGGGGRKRSGGAGGGETVNDLAGVKLHSTAPGPHAWGGSASVIDLFVTPFMLKQPGIERISSRKRSASDPLSLDNPDSDHNEANTLACAGDYPTTSGEAAARALAAAMGNSSWQPGSYDTFTIRVEGYTFRVQILWAVKGHFDHVHVGVSRVG